MVSSIGSMLVLSTFNRSCLFAECDKACDGCNGDGPDMCLQCGENYELKEGFCSSIKRNKEKEGLEISRYGTYVGLCLATCIIFGKNIYIASVIGLSVAVYIGVAEYTVRDGPPSLNPAESLKDAVADMLTAQHQ